MALQSVEPKYQEWLRKITPNNIYTNFIEISIKL